MHTNTPKTWYVLLAMGMILTYCCTNKSGVNSQPVSPKNFFSQFLEDVPETTASIDFDSYNIQLKKPSAAYASTKADLLTTRAALNKAVARGSVTMDSVSDFFTEALLNQIIPYWYGTPWTFEGHTNTPNDGSVACGYFVSTTLKHLGMDVNRYRMAQQSALSALKTVAVKDTVYAFINTSTDRLIRKVKKHLPEGIYVVGLDFHIGFLLHRNEEVFFIHSNYVDESVVTAELASDSPVFGGSASYYVCAISGNESFLKKWLRNDAFEVVMDK